MHAPSLLLALRLGGQDHALEPGRDYRIGSADDCDFRLVGLPAHAATLSVRTEGASIEAHLPGCEHNGVPLTTAPLAPADVLRFGDGRHEAVVVRDDGAATIVPVPALRAAARVRRAGAAAHAIVHARRVEAQTLDELLAHELRRAPWFTLSLIAHLLLLLLLWWCLPERTIGGDAAASVHVELAGEPAQAVATVTVPDVQSEAEPVAFEPPAAPPTPQPEAPEVPATDGAEPRPALDPSLAQVRIATPSRAASDGHGAGELAGTVGSGGFQRTVSELRRSGLEIVFVFDSTGSMTRTIEDTRASISQMLTVLQSLVPDARMGLVTYRDRGRNERYLTQQVPLGQDFWRAVNFMQFVTADGGGDRPEDVRAGLHAAFTQPWRPGARRVVVLAGDAPPHDVDFGKLLDEVRTFAADGRSSVHALITAVDGDDRDTEQRFARIAETGHGLCERMASRQRVLQRVLTFAFGRQFDRDIDAVIRVAEERWQRVDVQALDLVRRGGPELARALRANPLPITLWNALVRRPRRESGLMLVELLGADDTREPLRQAAAAALQRMLELPLPPIDPSTGERPTRATVDRLRAAVGRLPD